MCSASNALRSGIQVIRVFVSLALAPKTMDNLQAYASEQYFGKSDVKLACMSSDGSKCSGEFTRSELLRAVGPEKMQHFEKRQADNVLAAARLPNLVRCPRCDSAFQATGSVAIEPTFRCRAVGCGFQWCRLCNEAAHPGSRCETRAETDTRLAAEERLATASIRTCAGCGNRFVKESGCNKMTCPGCKAIR
eukprot:SAG31_NODE_1886_length_6989_cov_6.914514_5_plen_192_part_00